MYMYVKVLESLYRPEEAMTAPGGWGFEVLRQSTHEGGSTHRPSLPPRKYSWYKFLLEGHIATGRIMSMKNSSDTIGNRTRNLSACSAAPQPTTTSLDITDCNTITLSHLWIWWMKQILRLYGIYIRARNENLWYSNQQNAQYCDK
jgi:hypothetical protein